MSDMADVLEGLWEQGNCAGLDGWIGLGRGQRDFDEEAVHIRRRDVEKAVAALAAAGFGLVREARAVAWDEGYDKGTDLAAWAIGNRPNSERPDTSNPYRAVTVRGGE